MLGGGCLIQKETRPLKCLALLQFNQRPMLVPRLYTGVDILNT